MNGILSPPNVSNNGQQQLHQQMLQQQLQQASQQQRPAEGGVAAAISFASNQIYSNQNLTFQSQSNWDPSSGGGNAALMQQPNCASSPPSMVNLKPGRHQPPQMANYSAPSMVFVGPPPPTGAANGGGSSVQPPPQPTHMAPHPYHYAHPPPPAFPHQMQVIKIEAIIYTESSID